MITNYPSDGLAIVDNIPYMNAHGGRVYWVYNGTTLDTGHKTGSNGNKGTFSEPFATLDYAIGKCRANKHDMIMIKSGHAESVTTASAITFDVAGITVIGMGEGTNRPVFTFSSSTSASMVFSAANVSLSNVEIVANIDALANPLHVQAAQVTLDVTTRDSSSTVEAARYVLGTAAADRLKLKIKHYGYTSGDAGVNLVRLVGTDNADIELDYYGKASTGIVELHTTACTNVNVKGNVYNSGTSDFSKIVVDTVTGSTYSIDIFDEVGGSKVYGSSSNTTFANANAGSEFWITKTLTSSAITTAGVDITLTSSGGALAIRDIIVQTDATGLAGGTNFQITHNNTSGLSAFFVETVANLGANKTASILTASQTKIASVLESGKKLTAKATAANCTGSGTITIYILFQRLASGATISAA